MNVGIPEMMQLHTGAQLFMTVCIYLLL